MSEKKIYTDEYLSNLSKVLAAIIIDIKAQTSFIDIQDMHFVAAQMRQRADRYNSMAALNKNWSSEESDHLRAGAEAMETFVKFVEKTKKVEASALAAKEAEQLRDELSKLF